MESVAKGGLIASVFLLIAGLMMPAHGMDSAAAATEGPLIVQFEKNKAVVRPGEQKKIHDLMQRYDFSAQGNLFVVGYTDSTGRKAHNAMLARQRADSVRRVILAAGLDPARVIALGKGSELPLAANGHPEGRATNRRAEIHVSQAVARHTSGNEPAALPPSPAVAGLLDEADKALHLGRTDAALMTLQAARAQGGERTVRWNLLQGIAGFQAGRPAGQIWPHLQTVLRLEPGQPEAREYLGRLEAREQVNSGRVNAGMGLQPETAIAVASLGQLYGYLRLFEVRALSQQTLVGQPIAAWECRNAQGRLVTYYFDCSAVSDWAFGGDNDLQAAVPKSAKPAQTGFHPQRGANPEGRSRLPAIWQADLFE